MMKKLISIRGATQSENTKESIERTVCELCNAIVKENGIKSKNIVSIFFTVTKDINALNPATALRIGKTDFDCTQCALFCAQECEIEGGSPLMIRVMVTAYQSAFKQKKNIYINGAEKLRPDYVKK